MYELVDTPIPDVDSYLQRIGISKRDDPTRDYLDELVFAHQCSVPFEDLDSSYLHVPLSLDIPRLFEKVVIRKRGGFCFELNGLFCRLLKDLGFNAYSVFCHVVRTFPEPIPSLHRAVLVDFPEGAVLCDVGQGGPVPGASIEIGDHVEATIRGGVFHIQRQSEYWWLLSRTTSRGEEENIITFSCIPQHPVEFIPVNYYCSTSPTSVFSQKIIVNLRTETGNVNITGDIYSENINGVKTERRIRSRQEFESLLLGSFGIDLAHSA